MGGVLWRAGGRYAAPFPVGQQVGAMERGPVPDECQRPGFKGSRKDGPVDGDGRAPSGVEGVEVGDRMISLVPVHVDHHTVERAYPRPDMTVAFGSGDRGQLAELTSMSRVDGDLRCLSSATWLSCGPG